MLVQLTIYLSVKIRIRQRNNKLSYRILTLLCLIFLSACDDDTPINTTFVPTKSFVVAGHVYGSPNDQGPGMHPPFVEQFEAFQQQELDFIFLTGDVVFDSIDEQWSAFKSEMESAGTEYRIAPGNHDLANPEVYAAQIGSTFSSFSLEDNLFILLDSVSDDWSIEDEQLEEFISQLEGNNFQNIFIFVHNPIWWTEDNQFAQVVPNSFANYEGSTNYFADIEPRLKESGSEVHLFSGDFGANAPSTKLAFHRDENLHYYMSGMGSGLLDHYLLVELNDDGEVRVELQALGEDPDAFGVLEDYEIF